MHSAVSHMVHSRYQWHSTQVTNTANKNIADAAGNAVADTGATPTATYNVGCTQLAPTCAASEVADAAPTSKLLLTGSSVFLVGNSNTDLADCCCKCMPVELGAAAIFCYDCLHLVKLNVTLATAAGVTAGAIAVKYRGILNV